MVWYAVLRYRGRMNKLASLLLVAAAACGSSHSGGNTDSGTGNGDGNGSGDGGTTGGPATVTVTLTNHPTNAAMFGFIAAYQDGSGPWQLAPAPNGDVYTLSINSPAWSFAWTCVPPQFGAARVSLASFATSEKSSLTQLIPFGCTDFMPPAPVALTGTVNNINVNGGGQLLAYFGNPRNPAFVQVQGNTGTYTINTQPATHDIVIVHLVNNGGLGGDTNADAVAVARAVAVNGATTAPAIDFANASVTTAAVSAIPTTGMTHNASTRLFSAGGTQLTLASDNTTFESDALASADAATGDVYDQQIIVTENAATSRVQNWTATIADQAYTAPTALGGATSSVAATTPYVEIQTTWNANTGAVGYFWSASQGAAGPGTQPTLQWTAAIGPGYIGSSPKYTMPDLSALAGWSASLELVTGTQVGGAVTAWTSTAGISDFPVADAIPAAAGTQRTSVDARWTVTP